MSKMKEWLLDRQENGDDGTGYEGEGERDDLAGEMVTVEGGHGHPARQPGLWRTPSSGIRFNQSMQYPVHPLLLSLALS